MLAVKHLYSFKPFGGQKHQRSHSDMFNTTFRATMQKDSPYYRGRLGPYNIKHALVDPAHTHIHPTYHPTRTKQDYGAYDWKDTVPFAKQPIDKDSRKL